MLTNSNILSFEGFLKEAKTLLQTLPDPRGKLRTHDRLADSAIKLFAPHGSKGMFRDVKGIALDLHEASTEESSIAAVNKFVDGVADRLKGLYIYDQVHLRQLPLDKVLARLRRPLSKRRARTQLEGVITVLQGLLKCEIHSQPLPRKSGAKTRYPFVYVYLAYCRSDLPIIKKVAEFLKQYGIRHFLDEKDIFLGDSIPVRISDGLESYSHFLLFWSHAAVRSRFLDSEWGIAFMKDVYEARPIIPVLLDDAELPVVLSHKSHLTLSPGKDFARGMAQILRALRQS